MTAGDSLETMAAGGDPDSQFQLGVQYLYGNNKGTNVVPLTMAGRPVSGQQDQNGLFASAVWDEPSQSYIVKVVNVSDAPRTLEIAFEGLKRSASLTAGTCTTFHSDDPDADNTLDRPDRIVPEQSAVTPDGNTLRAALGARTFAIYRLPVTHK